MKSQFYRCNGTLCLFCFHCYGMQAGIWVFSMSLIHAYTSHRATTAIASVPPGCCLGAPCLGHGFHFNWLWCIDNVLSLPGKFGSREQAWYFTGQPQRLPPCPLVNALVPCLGHGFHFNWLWCIDNVLSLPGKFGSREQAWYFTGQPRRLPPCPLVNALVPCLGHGFHFNWLWCIDNVLSLPGKFGSREQAWYFTEATKAIASMPPGHCLGALEMLQ